MTAGGDPIHKFGTGSTQSAFTSLFELDYDTTNNKFILRDQDQQNQVVAEWDSSAGQWNWQVPVTVPGTIQRQRGDPTTSELDAGEVMTYNSDGSGTGSAGDLVYAINDSGAIKTQVIAQKSNAT